MLLSGAIPASTGSGGDRPLDSKLTLEKVFLDVTSIPRPNSASKSSSDSGDGVLGGAGTGMLLAAIVLYVRARNARNHGGSSQKSAGKKAIIEMQEQLVS